MDDIKIGDEQKELVIFLTKKYFEDNRQIPSLRELANIGIPPYHIRKLFTNVGNLFKQCKIPYFRRERGFSDDPEKMKEYIRSIVKIDPLSNCWTTEKLYMNSSSKRTKIKFKSKTMFLYQVSFLLFTGPLVSGLYIMHTCDNPSCINPEHLKQGTGEKNSQDRESKKRGKHIGSRPGPRHGLTDLYDYSKILSYIKSIITVSEKDEWLYPYTHADGYALINIRGRALRLHRLILANKLRVKYEDIDQACHKFPKDSPYYLEAPARNDVNPDHLYNGSRSQNSKDTLSYRKNIKLTPDVRNLICEEAKKIDFSIKGAVEKFDLKIATELGVSMGIVKKARVDPSNKGIHRGANKRPVIQLDKNGIIIQKFASATDASKLGFNPSNVWQVLAGINKSHKGFIWKYA